MNKKQAILAGNISVDISPVFTAGISSSFADIIHPGKITHIEGNEIHPGGSTANTGLAMSIFGIEPVISACIGDDDFGEMLRSMIVSRAGDGAADGLVKVKDSYTAYSIIMSAPGLDRAILQNPGANDEYTGDEISAEIMSACSLLHFGHPSSMRRIYSNNGEKLQRLMKRGNNSGLVTSLDLCAIDPASEAAAQNWPEVLAKVLPEVDFFVPSAEELCSIIDPALYADWQRRAAEQHQDLTDILSMDAEIMLLAEKAASWAPAAC
jgi:sugar/nucleoside kinase (ribokinase family)